MSNNFKLDWLQRRMSRGRDWVKPQELSLLAVSWNVDSRMTQELDSLFHTPADLVFVGLQEVTMATEAFMVQDSLLEEQWNMAIATALGRAQPTIKYCVVASKLLVGLYAVLFVREDLAGCLSQVQATSAACGLMGMVANKGAVAIGLKVQQTPLILISSHLAAHFENVKRRNQDYALIRRSLTFSEQRLGSPKLMEALSTLHPGPFNLDHPESGITVWLGDLNYRIALPGEEVRALVTTSPMVNDALLHLDQLAHEREQGRAFADFLEAPITFPPTYKFDRGTSEYDQSDKRRAPAWCDRILFKPVERVQTLEYRGHSEPRCSDHRPVTAVLAIKVDTIDEEAFAAAYSESLRELDQLENASIPVTQLTPTQISFGTSLRPYRQRILYLTLLNEGEAPAQYRFTLEIPAWLRVTPKHGMVLAGEAAEIALEVVWEVSTVRALLEKPAIDEILVISIEGGRDHFVNLTGQLGRTLYHRTLPEIHDHYPTMEVEGFGQLPAFFVTLLDVILQHRLEDDLFGDQAPDVEQLQQIEDAIEKDDLDKLRSFEAPLLAEFLIGWLDRLFIPVLPYEYFERAMYNAHDARLSRLMMEEILPRENQTVFHHLMHQLSRVPTKKDTLALIFGLVLIKPPTDWTWSRSAEHQLNRKRVAFLRHFLEP